MDLSQYTELFRAETRDHLAALNRLLLEWEPQVDLEEGIARCIAWYEAERDWAKDVVVY